MKLLRIRKNSISKKTSLAMLAVLAVQACLFLGAILLGGTLNQLDKNAFEILNERVINRKIDLQNRMLQQWSNLDDHVRTVNESVRLTLTEQGLTEQALVSGAPITTEVLLNTSEDMVTMLRRSGATSVFLVFNGNAQSPNADRAGLCLRDYDPNTAPGDSSDLLIARAPADIAEALGIPFDSTWAPQFKFGEMPEGASNFFSKPFDAALEHPGSSYRNLGYWASPFSLSAAESKVISYSVPLLTADGKPYGVLGVAITTEHLRRLMPYDELATSKDASYLLVSQNEQELDVLFSSGPLYQNIFGSKTALTRAAEAEYGIGYRVTSEGLDEKQRVYACIVPLTLYNRNTPFSDTSWALAGIMDSHILLGFSKGIANSVLIAFAITLALGLVCAYIISHLLTRPILSLSKQVLASNASIPVHLQKTNIYEIDEMSTAIEHLSRNVADSASKLSQIIELTSIRIGAFEYQYDSNSVYFTNHFFSILGFEDRESGSMDAPQFKTLLDPMRNSTVLEETVPGAVVGREGVYLCHVARPPNGTAWARLRVVSNDKCILGVVEDITQEMIEKKKIEHERDYDLLTNLLNRRAFHSAIEVLFARKDKLKISALIMLDLDNLKYINDTYGHDYGDQYIRRMAQILTETSPENSIVSRMSGDEFYVFIYGCSNKSETRTLIHAIQVGINDARLPLPDDPNFRVRASAGVAWYPDDATEPGELIRYADFAMYTVKNSVKGEFTEFNIESYKKDAYLLQGKEALNRLIDEELVDYHFQPIVDSHTGEIFAYEALMRPRLAELKNPMEVLTLARAQFKLQQIERLTTFLALEQFTSCETMPESALLFVNSITNQWLSEQDLAQFESLYGWFLPRMVLEFTEEERANSELTELKKEQLRRWGSLIALDDYGTGYNGDVSLLALEPDFVKLDMSIVRDVDHDPNRRQILDSLLTYAHTRGIRVIAEGVETYDEMKTLVESGADYMQGYYLGRPLPAPQRISPLVIEQLRKLSAENPDILTPLY